MKKCDFCSKHRSWVHVRTASVEAVLTSTHDLCFRAKIKKKMYTRANPSFTILKVGCKGVLITRTYFPDVNHSATESGNMLPLPKWSSVILYRLHYFIWEPVQYSGKVSQIVTQSNLLQGKNQMTSQCLWIKRVSYVGLQSLSNFRLSRKPGTAHQVIVALR